MSLKTHALDPTPLETTRIAQATFPRGNLYLTMRDELGVLFTDTQFADLFSHEGQPAQLPWRLALVTLMQFAENLSDRQAAEAVRSRIDWKYALALEITDTGFDFSILCEFRARLLQGKAEYRLLETLLTVARERSWLKARGKQRTDSTHVLAAVRALNRVECVGETLSHALNTLAEVAPDWLSGWLSPEWVDRYGRRFMSIRLPQQKTEREALALTIGTDGFALLERLRQPDAPAFLWTLPVVQTLRQVWIQNNVFEAGKLGWRDTKSMPSAAQSINSPHDPEARYSIKRDTVWCGYKVHFTETCDEEGPHLITHVVTTPGTTQDGQVTEQVHADLQAAGLLPKQHLVDEAYADAELLVESPRVYGIDLCSPVARESSWQAVSGAGFGCRDFAVDWENHKVTCPQGKVRTKWQAKQDASGNDVISVRFARADCAICAQRSLCTKSQNGPRGLSIRPKEQYLALQVSPAENAGVPQRVWSSCRDRRNALSGSARLRYAAFSLHWGAKDPSPHLLIAASLNLMRMVNWLMSVPLATTRRSALVRLALRNGLPTRFSAA